MEKMKNYQLCIDEDGESLLLEGKDHGGLWRQQQNQSPHFVHLQLTLGIRLHRRQGKLSNVHY